MESVLTFHDDNFCKFYVLYARTGNACALETRWRFVTERGKKKAAFIRNFQNNLVKDVLTMAWTNVMIIMIITTTTIMMMTMMMMMMTTAKMMMIMIFVININISPRNSIAHGLSISVMSPDRVVLSWVPTVIGICCGSVSLCHMFDLKTTTTTTITTNLCHFAIHGSHMFSRVSCLLPASASNFDWFS